MIVITLIFCCPCRFVVRHPGLDAAHGCLCGEFLLQHRLRPDTVPHSWLRLLHRSRHASHRPHQCYVSRSVKLPWIFPGAPLTSNGAPGNIQSNIDRLCVSVQIMAFICPQDIFPHVYELSTEKREFLWCRHKRHRSLLWQLSGPMRTTQRTHDAIMTQW